MSYCIWYTFPGHQNLQSVPKSFQWGLYFLHLHSASRALDPCGHRVWLSDGSNVNGAAGFLYSWVSMTGSLIRDHSSYALHMDCQVEPPRWRRLRPFTLSPRLLLLWQHAVLFSRLGFAVETQMINILKSQWMARDG